MAEKGEEKNGDGVNVETVKNTSESLSVVSKGAPSGTIMTSDKKKRPANNDDDASPSASASVPDSASEIPSNKRTKSSEESEGPLDLATTFGFKPGDRLEVEWEIVNSGSKDADDNVAGSDCGDDDIDSANLHKYWWSATLMEHDGRTEDSVAIRTLDYDPYPEGGFPERSQEDVIFLGKDLLIDPVTHQELHYRMDGAKEYENPPEDVCLGKEGIEKVVNETLMQAMDKNSAAWNRLTRAEQANIAEKIAIKKEKLMDLLLNHPKGLITSSDMKSILSQTMEEQCTDLFNMAVGSSRGQSAKLLLAKSQWIDHFY